ncbi:MAG: Phosphoheptose isomerase [Dehalococcoidia bacterium]|nr:Phosphoheptose isomerase [Bacillota bacterium]MBT9141759.1 Phosphoheptose isomerase [Bacillota bacterium]
MHIVDQSVTVYFHRLSELLLSTQVTDREGVALSLNEGAKEAVDMILSVRSASGKVMLIGNGGSAAIASHMQNDLCKAVGVRAIVFNEPPLLTALSNDHGYGCVFERPVMLWANSGDLLLAISSSGQSENILRAVRASMARECQVITLSGFSVDNPLRRMGHLNFYVPSQVYGYVELVHSVLAHFLTDCAIMSRSEKEKLA